MFLENYFCLFISTETCGYEQRAVWTASPPMFMMAISASGNGGKFVLSSYTFQ